jgi:hypothetical protein
MSQYDYVFTEFCPLVDGTRWHWIECLCADLRTLLMGVRANGGGGNCTFPIAVCAGIDFVSDLYGGDTKYLHETGACDCPKGQRFSQAALAAAFIQDCFDGLSTEIAPMLWDGMRNGLTHTFMPKGYKDGESVVRLAFESGEFLVPSRIERDGDIVRIVVNVYSLGKAFGRAVDRYEQLLRTDASRRSNFHKAWRSIEEQAEKAGVDLGTEIAALRLVTPNRGIRALFNESANPASEPKQDGSSPKGATM